MKMINAYSVSINNSKKEDICNSIISELDLIKFDNIKKEEVEVTFKNNQLRFGTPDKLRANVDNGSLKIITLEDKIEIRYESSSSFVIDLVIIFALLIIGITVETFFIFGSFLFFIQLFIKMNIIRTGNKALIKRILTRLGENSPIGETQKISFKPWQA